MIPNPWVLLGAAGAWFVSLVVCGWLLYARGHDDARNSYTESQLAQTQKDLAQFQGDASRIHDVATKFTGIQFDLGTQFTSLSQDLQNAIKAKPLPPGCLLDPARLRALTGAIAAANTATGLKPSPAVPGHP